VESNAELEDTKRQLAELQAQMQAMMATESKKRGRPPKEPVMEA